MFSLNILSPSHQQMRPRSLRRRSARGQIGASSVLVRDSPLQRTERDKAANGTMCWQWTGGDGIPSPDNSYSKLSSLECRSEDAAALRQCVELGQKEEQCLRRSKLWRAKAVRCRLAPRAGRERARRNALCRHTAESWLADAKAAQGTSCKTNVPTADSLCERALSCFGRGFRAGVLACCRSKIAGCASTAVQSQ